jgi:hypothetical protein
MRDVLILKTLTPVASGGGRLVFQHPHDRNLLIKVDGQNSAAEPRRTAVPWYKRYRRFHRYRQLLRELNEYVACVEATGKSPGYTQRVVGLVETDYRLGLLTEALRGRDGRLAPTLQELAATGRFDAAARADLEQFCGALLEGDMVICDLHPGNLVHAWDGATGHRFVMVDGHGNKTLFPLALLCRFSNRLCKRYKILRLWQTVSSAAPSPTGRKLTAGVAVLVEHLLQPLETAAFTLSL